MANVAIQSFHIPKYPIRKNATAAPATSFQFLEPIQAKPQIISIIIGQGVLFNNFSNLTKKNNNGSKKASIPSPYDFEKSRKAKSIPFLNSARADLSIPGNFVKNSIKLQKINEPNVNYNRLVK